MKKNISVLTLKPFFSFRTLTRRCLCSYPFNFIHTKPLYCFSDSNVSKGTPVEIPIEKDQKFESIVNQQSLQSTLFSLKTPTDVLNIFEKNEILFKRPDIILAYKMLARTMNIEESKELNLKTNKTFERMSTYIQNQLVLLDSTGIFFTNKIINYSLISKK